MAFEEGVSIYLQVARMVEDDILAGRLGAEDPVPSTNAFARHFNINPATVAKGFALLVDEGIIYKRRGLGMFVTQQGRELVCEKRRRTFFETRIPALCAEARALGVEPAQLAAAVRNCMEQNGGEKI